MNNDRLLRERIQLETISMLLADGVIKISGSLCKSPDMFKEGLLLRLRKYEIDCNNCRYISVNEREQRLLKDLGILYKHTCTKFESGLEHSDDYSIYPCIDCNVLKDYESTTTNIRMDNLKKNMEEENEKIKL